MTDVVVIGHGRSPEGRGWGSKIDACTTVLRLWDWHWQAEADYGRRYDIGMYEIARAHMENLFEHNQHHPQYYWIAVALKKRDYKGSLLPNTQLVDTRFWEQEGLRLGGEGVKQGAFRLTRGAVLAAWAMETPLLLNISRLILVGFDNVYDRYARSIEEGYPSEYAALPSARHFNLYEAGATKYGNHDYAAEGPLLKAIAERNSVELVHAQDIW